MSTCTRDRVALNWRIGIVLYGGGGDLFAFWPESQWQGTLVPIYSSLSYTWLYYNNQTRIDDMKKYAEWTKPASPPMRLNKCVKDRLLPVPDTVLYGYDILLKILWSIANTLSPFGISLLGLYLTSVYQSALWDAWTTTHLPKLRSKRSLYDYDYVYVLCWLLDPSAAATV